MIERTIEKRINSLREDFKIIYASGARQVGKTTLLKSMKEATRTYVTLDDKADREIAKADPDAFFLLHPIPCCIDEAQRAEELFIPMKRIVDENPAMDQIWITGSQKIRLSKNVGDTLAGRVAIVNIYPLSQAEKQNDPQRSSFYPSLGKGCIAPWTYTETIENVVMGGYPSLMSIKAENRTAWFSSYIETYLLGDIAEEVPNISLLTFMKVLRILAARTATSLNISAVASEAGLDQRKIKSLISILEACSIIHLLPPYEGNTLKSIVKTPRLHFTDSGLCCYLLGIHSIDGFLRHPLKGAIFESYAVSELIRNAKNNGDAAAFYFYREENNGSRKGPAEIDLIKEQDGIIYPIEIKLKTTPEASDAKNFDVLESLNTGMSTIVCLHDRKTIMRRDVLVMPVSAI